MHNNDVTLHHLMHNQGIGNISVHSVTVCAQVAYTRDHDPDQLLFDNV